MRKLSLLLCFVLLIQMLYGCASKKEELQQPVTFYYANKAISYNTPDAVIGNEIREGASFHTLEDLLHVYLNGPLSSELLSMIPKGVALQSCVVEGNIAHIYLNTQFAELSGIKLTTVCSGILLTVNEYTGIQTVAIRAENAKLDDKEVFLLSIDDIVLMDAVTQKEAKE